MSRRVTHLRERDRDDVVLLSHSRPTAVPAGKSAGLHGHVLSLQRSYGNTAVRTLLVQRRERPQSTDAPGVKRNRKPLAKTSEPEDYAPTEPNKKLSSWETAALVERGRDELDSKVKNSWYFAAELYEEYWFRTKQRAAGDYLARAYKKLGDAKREAFWRGVAMGTITPGKKKNADDDMSDKHF